jgi:predicted nucleic acid-binding protein
VAIVVFDSSALVKLLVDEEGSDVAAQLWDGADAVVCSQLAHVEVCAALAAAERDHRLAPAHAATALRDWESLWKGVRTVDLGESIAREAGHLTGQYALRGADAVHLATVAAVGVDDAYFAVWDLRLRESAAALGAHVVPHSL